ncbi:unnamed protein product [Ilex paraguariensis]|uniref:Uncharacterized protein n=1 Tax=Ilex paraguariensis TaxID=185542 RepID=A0ABC8TRB0_9AQUA
METLPFYNSVFNLYLTGRERSDLMEGQCIDITVLDLDYMIYHHLNLCLEPGGLFRLRSAKDVVRRKQLSPDNPLKAGDTLGFRYESDSRMLVFKVLNR